MDSSHTRPETQNRKRNSICDDKEKEKESTFREEFTQKGGGRLSSA